MLEKVAAIIREQLNQENVEITEATRFKEDLEVDSLDLFELVMAFEEEYGVSIPSEELENMATVGDVIISKTVCFIINRSEVKSYRKFAVTRNSINRCSTLI